MLAAKYENGGAYIQLFDASFCKNMRTQLRSSIAMHNLVKMKVLTPLIKVCIHTDLCRFMLGSTSINQIKSLIGSAFISDAVITR